MSTNTRYLLAKYIPDLRRGEPHNVGIVLWSPSGVEARFIAEKQEQRGEIDGRSVPSFVTSPSAYKQWVYFWRTEAEKTEIEPATGGNLVQRTSCDFLEALRTANRGNFVLEEGGILLDDVSEEELPNIADHLFYTLVETTGPDEPRDSTLDEVCDDLLRASDLFSNPYFHNDFSLRCPVNGTEEEYVFSHAIKNGSIEKIFQRVPFPLKRKKILRKNIHDVAWRFEKVIEADIVASRKDRGDWCAVSEKQQRDPGSGSLVEGAILGNERPKSSR